MKYLSIDVGTTKCKCQLFDDSGEILEYISSEYDLKKVNGELYVDIDAIWQNVSSMIEKVAENNEIDSICVSSFGESFVLLDKDDNVLFYPMLYTDTRGGVQARSVNQSVGEDKLFLTTGVLAHSMYSISKLLWIKENYPKVYKNAEKLLLIGDYVGYKLTGKRVIDYSLAARTGVFDIENKTFSKEILSILDINESLFSTPREAGSIVGEVSDEILCNLKIKGKPVVVLGSHDQICSAIGAGAFDDGDAVDGMGTVECIVSIFKDKPNELQMAKKGYPVVPFINGLYCTYILNYSCGAAVGWFNKNVMHGYCGQKRDFFSYMEDLMCVDLPTNEMCLPYFSGASTPYQDNDIKAAIINVGTQTTDAQLYQSIVESTIYEMKLNAETIKGYGVEIKNLVATGGCSLSNKWMQLKSNIQNVSVKVLRSNEGGLCGCAILQALALNSELNVNQARKLFVRYKNEFVPNISVGNEFVEKYEKYKKLYFAIKNV